MLLRKAIERLGAEHVLTGHAIKSFDAGGPKARAVFENRRSGDVVAEVQADLLIAADGVHSTVRAALYPDEGLPRAIQAACCGAAPACSRRSSPAAR